MFKFRDWLIYNQENPLIQLLLILLSIATLHYLDNGEVAQDSKPSSNNERIIIILIAVLLLVLVISITVLIIIRRKSKYLKDIVFINGTRKETTSIKYYYTYNFEVVSIIINVQKLPLLILASFLHLFFNKTLQTAFGSFFRIVLIFYCFD